MCLGFATLYAEDYTYLTIVEQNDVRTSLTAVGLTITFSDNSLTATNAYTGESKVIALNNLVSMNFSNNDETAIQNVTTDNLFGTDSSEVYTLQGRKLPTGVQPSKGIYIIRKDNVTQKLQVK